LTGDEAPDSSGLATELLPLFVEEVAGRLDAVDGTLAALPAAGDRERARLLGELRREAHTIKGSSRVLALDSIEAEATALEKLFLDAERSGGAAPGLVGKARARVRSLRRLVALAAGAAAASPLPAERPREAAGARTILYVEDSVSNRRLLELLFADRDDVELLTAATGTAGIALATERRPDVVLLDLNLPDVPGEDVLRRLRNDSATGGTPVVVLSADATQGQVDRILAAGAHTYLTKPLDLQRLLALLDELLGASGPG
jgi:CheY-like chemotaxis protein